jgi:hypothetical protein
MLCGSCEARLSDWERQVATTIFRPIHRDQIGEFQYGSWFLKFAVSLSFRALKYYEGCVRAEPDQVASVVKHCNTAIKDWAAYLLGHTDALAPHAHHCVVLPAMKEQANDHRSLRSFFDGVIDFQPAIAPPDGGIYVVSKMCRLCIIGTIKPERHSEWVNTHIASEGGSFRLPFATPSWFIDYLHSRFVDAREGVQRLSQRQRDQLWQQSRQHGWEGPE